MRFCSAGEAVAEGAGRRAVCHAAFLMRSALIVSDEVVVEHDLHFLDGLEPGLASLGADVLVVQRMVEALDDALELRPLHFRRAMLDLLQLQQQLVGTLIGTSTELAHMAAQNDVDLRDGGLEARDDIVVHELHHRDRQLGRV